MCQKCQNSSCDGCGGNETAQLQNQVAELQSTVDEISQAAKFLLNGHPVIWIEDSEDIASFDTGSGKGSDNWEDWAICDGKTHKSTKGKNIITPNLTEKFIVGAGGQYEVGDTGGADTITLTIPQIPTHDHTLNDSGHTHSITDPGHDHGLTDPGHDHGAGNHTHTFVTSSDGDHFHDVAVGNQGTGQRAGGGNDTATSGAGTYSTDTRGNHFHTGTTDPGGGGNSGASFTGLDVNPAFTGVTANANPTGITMNDTGGGESHENRPPYYAGLFVKRIG